MPIWCNAEMLVKGSKENKRALANLFLSYDSKINESKNRYFARTWLNYFPSDNLEEELEKEVSVFFLDVACSVHYCMISGYPNGKECPTIFEISKELDLEIQIASDEQECCFTEFYYIKNGELIIDDCEDFPDDEYDSKKLYNDYLSSYSSNENPLKYDDWYDREFIPLMEEWYFRAYEKFTF